MPVAVVNVGVMPVGMGQNLVPMFVRMRFVGRIARSMGVLVMLVVRV